MPRSEVERAIEAHRERLLLRDRAAMQAMAKRWLEVEQALEARVMLLAQQASERRADGRPASAREIYEMEHYTRLLAQARAETRKYAEWAAKQIEGLQELAAEGGIAMARDTIRGTYLDAGKVPARFDLLALEAVEVMIGLAGDGTPLNRLLMRDFAESAARMTQTLIESTAMGRNPRETARLMQEDMAGNLNRALTIARTEQVRAFRTAATEQMKASGVVEGWIWRCALQDRTCLACLAMDGQRFGLDEELNDHPNGRCFKQPIIKGLEPLGAESGAEWFARQSKATQRAMMGPQRYEAWKAGAFVFGSLAGRSESAEWGASVRVASMEELIRAPRADTEGESELTFDLFSDQTDRLGLSLDIRGQYDSGTPGAEYLTAREVYISPSRKHHIQEDHPFDKDWIQQNPSEIIRAIQKPEIIDSAPRTEKKNAFTVAHVVKISVENAGYPNLVVVVKYQASQSRKAFIHTIYRAEDRFLYERGGLKERWQRIKK